MVRRQQGELLMGWVLFLSILQALSSHYLTDISDDDLGGLNRSRALLFWAVHTCQFVMFSVRMLSVAALEKLPWHGLGSEIHSLRCQ